MKLTDAERALVERARSGMDEACEKGATYSPFWIVELVKIIDRLSQEPEVVESEWVNIKPCTNDAVEYADYVTFLARAQMHIEWWECKNCGGFDQGASTRKPRYCRCCGALMRNGDFDKSKPNDGERKEGT